eukprot:scaffold154780_cov23-Cyclotella_meneghiniana.AAC.2
MVRAVSLLNCRYLQEGRLNPESEVVFMYNASRLTQCRSVAIDNSGSSSSSGGGGGGRDDGSGADAGDETAAIDLEFVLAIVMMV